MCPFESGGLGRWDESDCSDLSAGGGQGRRRGGGRKIDNLMLAPSVVLVELINNGAVFPWRGVRAGGL